MNRLTRLTRQATGCVAVGALILFACREVAAPREHPSAEGLSPRVQARLDAALARNRWSGAGHLHNTLLAGLRPRAESYRKARLERSQACRRLSRDAGDLFLQSQTTPSLGPAEVRALTDAVARTQCRPGALLSLFRPGRAPLVRFASFQDPDTASFRDPNPFAQALQDQVFAIGYGANSSDDVAAALESVYSQAAQLTTAEDSAWVLVPAATLLSSAVYWEENPPGGSGTDSIPNQMSLFLFRAYYRLPTWALVDLAGCVGGLGLAWKLRWFWPLGIFHPEIVVAACGIPASLYSAAVLLQE